MKRKTPTEKRRNISLLSSMLLLFFSALTICIALTILFFSVFGRSVYTNLMKSEMTAQADLLAEESMRLIDGEITYESYRFMMRSVDSTVVVLDAEAQPFDFRRDRPNQELPAGPEDPKKGGDIMMNEENLQFCRALFGKASAEPHSNFTYVDSQKGVVTVASLIEDEDEAVYGAVFLIRPMTDISSTSRSLLVVLIFSSLAVGVIMLIPLYFLARRLTNPLKKLTGAAGGLSDGDYSIRVVPDGTHEVRELGETFNTLAESLQSNIGELTVERNRLQAILDGLSEGIIGFDTSGSVTKFNSSAVRLLGGKEELPFNLKVQSIVNGVLEAGGGRAESFTLGERVIRVSATAIEEEKGRTVGAVALLMDVTEAERLEQTRRDYVANVSHELRTPLASIRGIADMLNDGLVKSEDDRLRYYGYILKESIRLSTLINDLLELSRLQSGGVALKVRRMELYELMADVADRMTEPAAERGMRVELDVKEGKYLAVSNQDRVEQVLITLMDNAVKHGTEGGAIRVSLGENENKWLISVENPAEVEKKDLDHLFERFYKADTAHSSEGTGLGLAIAEEVLELLGESITVSCEDGKIRFTFTVTKKQ